jgi:hypothetical protein
MGGMGANQADVPSMMLLPELLFRWNGLGPLLTVPEEWSRAPECVPAVDGGPIRWQRDWCDPGGRAAQAQSLPRRIGRHLPASVRRAVRRVRPVRTDAPSPLPVGYLPLGWQPASWYRPWWPRMRAFALPSFYDGRIRVNLEGREAHGLVPRSEYASVCAEIEETLLACTDPRTGAPAVAAVERAEDPARVGSAGADLVIVWGPSVNGFQHPRFGLVGPVPHRRPGGHTGPYGYAALAGPGLEPGDHGLASSFDVAPTILDLLGRERPEHVSGTSLLGRLGAAPRPAPV